MSLPYHINRSRIAIIAITRSYAAILLSLTASCGLLLVALGGCKDPYVSPYKSPVTGYLVVEGYISGNSITQFALSRTIPLPGDSTLPTENGATVQIQGSDNSSYPLVDTGSGVYRSIDTLNLNPQLEYRLSIQTSNGEKYLSELVPYKITPPIDSVSWVLNGDNSVNIFVSTHDPANNTRYYQWSYDQTYEYTASEESLYYWDKDTIPNQLVMRTPSQQVYYCWQNGSSTNILIDNTSKLTSDVVYLQPVNYIPPNNVQISVMYSILVKQYALTNGGYSFLSLMQSNTESLGSIFDAQPSQITGNIHSLTNPTEQVIGYVSAGTVQSKRIFISRSQVLSDYYLSCPGPDTAFLPINTILRQEYTIGGYTPLYYGMLKDGLTGWISNSTFCVDCTSLGGTNVKPSYWPY